MGLISSVWGAIRKMLKVDKIEKITKHDVSVSEVMQAAQAVWDNMYRDEVPWKREIITNGNGREETVQHPILGLPSIIVEELARLSLLEFDFVGLDDKGRGEYINKQIAAAIEDETLSDALENGLAVGGFVAKPYTRENGTIGVEFIAQNRVFPLSGNDDKVTGCIFPTQKTDGDTIYTRLEIHELNKKGEYMITNYAFKSDNVEVPFKHAIELAEVQEWEHLEAFSKWGGIKAPMFSFFKVPLKNKIDETSPLGISIYYKAIAAIEQADKQWDRFLWEFEATEQAIHVDEVAMNNKIDKNGHITSRMPKGKERLYRVLSSTDGDGYIKNYAPDIRDESQINGLNTILMLVEKQVGLNRGTLSFDVTDKSYTNELELKLIRNKAENTIARIQENLTTMFVGLARAIDVLADINDLDPGSVEITQEDFAVIWGDSLIIDDKSKQEEMRQDVNDGLIPKWMYVAEKYGLSEEDAKNLTDEAGSNAIASPYGA